jgi:hypothetical protein
MSGALCIEGEICMIGDPMGLGLIRDLCLRPLSKCYRKVNRPFALDLGSFIIFSVTAPKVTSRRRSASSIKRAPILQSFLQSNRLPAFSNQLNYKMVFKLTAILLAMSGYAASTAVDPIRFVGNGEWIVKRLTLFWTCRDAKLPFLFPAD